MVNKQKVKGTKWEHDAVEILNMAFGKDSFKRIPGSGAFGTVLKESDLTSDIKGQLEFSSKPFRIECKVGYGGAKSMTVFKEWFDKVGEEARAAMAYPLLMAKFSGARDGTKFFVAMDVDTFIELLTRANKLKEMVNKEADDG